MRVCVCLIAAPRHAGGYAQQIPAPFTPVADKFLVQPIHHIFGSDELSARAPVMAERFQRLMCRYRL
jgi:NADH-quinone oxidoreductase subunit G